MQGWGAGVGAGCFWFLGAWAAWEENQEPEPLEKKVGAGAAKEIAAPQPCLNVITFVAIHITFLNLFDVLN